MFDRMASLRSDPHEVEALETLAVLERTMRNALNTLFEQLNIERPDHTVAKRRGREAGDTLGTATWPSFLAPFDEGTTRALAGYSRLREAAPDPDIAVLVALTSHEEALRAFAQLEQSRVPDSLARFDRSSSSSVCSRAARRAELGASDTCAALALADADSDSLATTGRGSPPRSAVRRAAGLRRPTPDLRGSTSGAGARVLL